MFHEKTPFRRGVSVFASAPAGERLAKRFAESADRHAGRRIRALTK